MSSLENHKTTNTLQVVGGEEKLEVIVPSEDPGTESSAVEVVPKLEDHLDNRSSPTMKRILYSLTVLAILGGLHHLWVEPIVIKAPFGQTITTALPDHSIVQLNSGTTLTYNRSFGWVDRRVKLNGEAFFIVKGSNQPFEVVTDNSVLKSVNTKFNVRAWTTDPDKETVVTLVKGKLDFVPTADPKKSVTLLSGQTSRIFENSSQPTEPEIANVIHTISWRENGLSFDSQPLSVIFGEMERRYNIMIRTTNTNILQDSLTIFIARPTGPKDVLNNICQAAKLKYSSTDKGYLVSRN